MKKEDLKLTYSEELFKELNNQLIDVEFVPSQLSISLDNSKLILKTKYCGKFDDLDLHVLAIEHSSTEDARVGVSLAIFKLMKKYSLQNALVAAYSKNADSWRYSLVTSNLSINDKGKVTKQFSNPRRFSFVLGPNQKVLTPYKQIIQKGMLKNVEELKNRFSVEVVNNEFYSEIAKLYDELIGIDNVQPVLKFPTRGEASHEFAVRLIGRVIFCWFLREKRSEKGTPLIPEEILSRDAVNKENYYHSILAPLFFEVLNKRINSREENFQSGVYKSIPYLNGGLFNPDLNDHYKFDKASQIAIPDKVDVPDKWLRSLFDLLELYNFTVDENTNYDIDLSIDPEMLGRIFENLLARINPDTGETVRKMTGSFYTPREIVDYMVDESLLQYLKTSTEIEINKLAAVISFELSDDEGFPLSDVEREQIINSLGSVKILDPACGSGAFPIGILQKIVYILQQVDPDSRKWLDRQLSGAGPELRHHLEKEFENKNFNYLRKLGVIRESIYGVDIQPIATEISRLRCFLTLIVDQSVDDKDDNRGIEPLPNLDFKFVTANSLFKLHDSADSTVQTGLFEDTSGIDELRSLRNDYFNSHNHEREMLKLRFSEQQNQMLQDMITNRVSEVSDLTQKLSTWKPFSHNATNWFDPEWMFGISEGFHIIIGNPPYIYRKVDDNKLKEYFKANYFNTSGNFDLYKFFIEMSLNMTIKDGVNCLITNSSYLLQSSFEKTREFILSNAEIKVLAPLGPSVFDGVTVDTAIYVLNKSVAQDSEIKVLIPEKPKSISVTEPFIIHQKRFLDNAYLAFDVQLKQNEYELINRLLKDYDHLEKGYDFGVGINTGYIKSELTSTSKIDSRYHPMVSGRGISKYAPPRTDGYIMYDRAFVRSKGKLGRALPDERFFIDPKILVVRTRNIALKERIISTIDSNKNYNLNRISNIVAKDGFRLEGLLGLLNSSLYNWIFSKRFLDYEIKPIYLRNSPLCDTNDELLNNLVTELLHTKSQDPLAETKRLEEKIDERVYELFNLSTDEITIVEGPKDIRTQQASPKEKQYYV